MLTTTTTQDQIDHETGRVWESTTGIEMWQDRLLYASPNTYEAKQAVRRIEFYQAMNAEAVANLAALRSFH